MQDVKEQIQSKQGEETAHLMRLQFYIYSKWRWCCHSSQAITIE